MAPESTETKAQEKRTRSNLSEGLSIRVYKSEFSSHHGASRVVNYHRRQQEVFVTRIWN